MPVALNRDIRKLLETAVRDARVAAEAGATTALGQLGVADANRPSWLNEKDAALRVRLRAHARTLGDTLDTGDAARMPRLIREIAYAHWHRALFARFLLENGLLVDVEAGNAPVRPNELRDIAEAEDKDVAEVAAEFAAPMLPEIFPKDDPVLALTLPPETRQRLAELVDGLPAQTFKADDALGWTYQFWQADRKKKVNESEVKIGADELPAVTQLFTEDYMVLFLLENTLGAWWAGKKLAENPDLARNAIDEDALRRALAPPGYTWTYLRFVREDEVWRPAAGTFPAGRPARPRSPFSIPAWGRGTSSSSRSTSLLHCGGPERVSPKRKPSSPCCAKICMGWRSTHVARRLPHSRSPWRLGNAWAEYERCRTCILRVQGSRLVWESRVCSPCREPRSSRGLCWWTCRPPWSRPQPVGRSRPGTFAAAGWNGCMTFSRKHQNLDR